MKNTIKSFSLIIAIGLATLISCQDEESTNSVGAGSLGKNSPLTTSLQRLMTASTSIDNVIDSTDCFRVKLPVQVIVSGTTITVDDAGDYQTVSAALSQTTAGGPVDFVYPITLLTPSYDEIPIANEAAFQSAVENCTMLPGEGDCFRIDYPITVSVYDAASQNPSTVTIDNNQEFYLTLAGLGDSDVYQIRYPITANDQSVSISNNTGFENAIAQAVANCGCDNDTILTDGLILYLTFANEVRDLTGLGNSLAIGDTSFVTDRSNNSNGAIFLEGGSENNQVVTAGNTANDMLQDEAFTVSIWFNRQADNFQGQSESLFTTNLLDIVLEGPNTGIRSPKVIAPGVELVDQDWIDGALFGQVGIWHHIVLTYSGTQLSLYRDGELRDQQTMTFPQSMMSPNFLGGSFQGYLDDVRVYKRSLNAQDVLQLYNLEGDLGTCLD